MGLIAVVEVKAEVVVVIDEEKEEEEWHNENGGWNGRGEVEGERKRDEVLGAVENNNSGVEQEQWQNRARSIKVM
ncbi:hypothetical protein PIB30_026382 [Stylosanthes scabra]|uniref:Uncharacterized protein n=1 Tax=Stylosanthes scabra TaxID=79078 RepID=A0ABU6RAQ5_9FABA|nr:hypothetical protein [Stylosanthes scabra]